MVIPTLIQSRISYKLGVRVERAREKADTRACLLDLPDLALECVLERLLPAELSNMASVCSSLRDKCRSDHLWEKHMREKWGKLVGEAAYKEWQCYMESRNRQYTTKQGGSFFGYLSRLFPMLLNSGDDKRKSCLPDDSIMALYLSLESGKFWIPAQVYNRENGHVGFMLSCYDAEVSYDSKTNTFTARYSAQGRRTTEDNIEWNRLRAPTTDTPAHVLHVSNCLNDLNPGDHIEIQWRRNKEFPYGWWYGVVGHLESCNESTHYCHCHSSDTLILEFKHYTLGSRWRRVVINRKDHHEVGDETTGFYGGIRKVYSEEQILSWKRLWPTHVVE